MQYGLEQYGLAQHGLVQRGLFGGVGYVVFDLDIERWNHQYRPMGMVHHVSRN